MVAGIVPEKQAAIFRAFEQADSSITNQYCGWGLVVIAGLAPSLIAPHILERTL